MPPFASFQFGAPVAQQINANSQDVVDVLMYNWGVNIKDSYPPVLSSNGVTVLNSPAFPFTPTAVMIGPRSQIDRCFIAWNYQSGPQVQTRTVVRVLSAEAPLLFPQTTNVGHISSTDADPIIATAQARGLLYVTPHVFPVTVTEADSPGSNAEGFMTTLLPEQYMKADGSLQAFLSQTTGDHQGELPLLHLQFFLKPSPLAQPTKRFPYHNAVSIPATDDGEHLLWSWPVYGRKTISLQVRSSLANIPIRVAALRNVQRNYRIQETTEGEQTSTVVNGSMKFRFCDLAADYLLLYATRDGVNSTITATIAAYD